MFFSSQMKLFRFSFSWSRLLPTANASEPNPLGVEHYHNVIQEIINNGMTPTVKAAPAYNDH